MKNETFKILSDPKEIFSLNDKVILILGGAGKMGQEFSSILSKSGATVYIIDLDQKNIDKILKDFSNKNISRVKGFKCDLMNESDIKKCFSSILKAEGRIDVMIYNVYSKPKDYYKPLEDYPVETWEKAISANVKGAFICSKEIVKIFKEKKISGNIILTLSTYGLVSPDHKIYENLDSSKNIYGAEDSLTSPMVYSVSKSGLLGMVKWLAGAYGKHNIRVNGLTPGGVYDGQEENFHKAYLERVPLGRMANWSDYNGAILFLSSDASQYMTGSNLVIDGGWTAK